MTRHASLLLSSAAALLLMPPASRAGGSFGKLWGIQQESGATAGFDSNIYGSANNERSDGFTSLSHRFLIGRKNSLSRAELSADVAGTWFISEHDGNTIDGGVELNAGYPTDPGDVSSWNANAYWRSQHDIDYRVAQRMKIISYGTGLSGEWLSSPKLGFTGELEADVQDRSDLRYYTSRKIRASLGVSHARHPEQRWNLEYGFEVGETDPDNPSLEGTDSISHILGFRARGRLLPKVTGNVFLGIRHTDFSGRYDFSDTGPRALANVTWAASAQLTAQISARADYQFTASGEATQRTAVEVNVKRKLARGFAVSGSLAPSVHDYFRNAGNRRDQVMMLAATLEYARTERFFGSLSAMWVSSDSNQAGWNASRTLITLTGRLRY